MHAPLGEYAAASIASCTWEQEHAMADFVYDVPAVVKPSKLRKLCQADGLLPSPPPRPNGRSCRQEGCIGA